MKPEDAAKFLSVSPATIYRLIRKKKLPKVLVGADIRVPTVALERYITDRITVPDAVSG